MIYLAGSASGNWRLRSLGHDVGLMMSPAHLRKPFRDMITMPYAIDNGLYRPPDVEPAQPKDRLRILLSLVRIVSEGWPLPMFAVVPDVPYDGKKSAVVSRYWLGVLRELFPDVPLAVAVQDGMVEYDLDGYDWCAIAGSTEWKLKTLNYWADAARARGMKIHLLRANTAGRIYRAQEAGCDSADGTGIWRGDKNQRGGVLLELKQMGMFPITSAPASPITPTHPSEGASEP